jgi:FlaA1/EpsC-like NDP-sugar epimerase
MLRRFSINFALFSIFLDALAIIGSLASMTEVRLWMNRLSFIQPIASAIVIPLFIYVSFTVLWIFVLAAFAIYDGRKYYRAADEFSALTAASFIAGMCQAGIIYLTYREISRAYFLAFVFLAYLLCLVWRIIARIFFRLRKDHPSIARNALIVGGGTKLGWIKS